MDRFDARETAYGWSLIDTETLDMIKEKLSESDAKSLADAWNEAAEYLQTA